MCRRHDYFSTHLYVPTKIQVPVSLVLVTFGVSFPSVPRGTHSDCDQSNQWSARPRGEDDRNRRSRSTEMMWLRGHGRPAIPEGLIGSGEGNFGPFVTVKAQ